MGGDEGVWDRCVNIEQQRMLRKHPKCNISNIPSYRQFDYAMPPTHLRSSLRTKRLVLRRLVVCRNPILVPLGLLSHLCPPRLPSGWGPTRRSPLATISSIFKVPNALPISVPASHPKTHEEHAMHPCGQSAHAVPFLCPKCAPISLRRPAVLPAPAPVVSSIVVTPVIITTLVDPVIVPPSLVVAVWAPAARPRPPTLSVGRV